MKLDNELGGLPEGWVSIPPVIVSPFSYTSLAGEPYHISQRNLRELHKISDGGEGIKVAVIDSGIQRTHSEFAKCLKGVHDATNPSRGNGGDDHGHGTHVCSTIGGVKCGGAPNVELHSIKALDDSGAGSDVWIERGLLMAIELKVHAVNMSLGSPTPSNRIMRAVTRAFQAGIIVFAATGNDGLTRNCYPADFNDICVAVAAVDKYLKKANFSNSGTGTDICDYGVDVIAAMLNGGFTGMSGTSMATPNATAMACNRLSYELKYGMARLPLLDQYKTLQSFCKDISTTGRDRETGWGILDEVKLFGQIPVTKNPEPNPPVGNPGEPKVPDSQAPTGAELAGYLWRYPDGKLVVSNTKDQVLVL